MKGMRGFGRRVWPFVIIGAVGGCADVKDGLNDVGKVRATFYRHELKVAGATVGMPGDRLVPDGPCNASAESGLFDPCRPEAKGVELDAWGMPKTPPGPYAGRAAPPPPAVRTPPRKPTAAAARTPARKAAKPSPGRAKSATPVRR